MELEEIIAAVDDGRTVYWSCLDYQVVKSQSGNYWVQRTVDKAAIGLRSHSGRLYGRPTQYFEVEEVRRAVLALAYTCGLDTVGAATRNMEIHAGNMWLYADVPDRLAAIRCSFAGIPDSDKVVNHLSSAEREKVDQLMDEMMKQPPQKGERHEF